MPLHIPSTISPQAQAFYKQTEEAGMLLRDLMDWPKTLDPAAWEGLRAAMAAASPDIEPVITKYGATIDATRAGPLEALSITPKGWPASEASGKRVLVHFHGGGYVVASPESLRTSSVPIADATGLKVISVRYPLAPGARWRTITKLAAEALSSAIDAHGPTNVAVYGESAGGGLAAAAVLRLLDEGKPAPAALVLISPWSDLGNLGDTAGTLADAEPMYVYEKVLEPAALAYADREDWTNPLVSPVYATYAPTFPPTLIQAGTKEIFLSHAVRHARVLKDAGVPTVLDVYEGMYHGFHLDPPGLPESITARKEITAFLRTHLGGV